MFKRGMLTLSVTVSIQAGMMTKHAENAYKQSTLPRRDPNNEQYSTRGLHQVYFQLFRTHLPSKRTDSLLAFVL